MMWEFRSVVETEIESLMSESWSLGRPLVAKLEHLHKETEANRNFVKYTMDLLSLPEYVIKKGRPHGHRYGKKPGDKEYYLANLLKKKCKKEKVPRNP